MEVPNALPQQISDCKISSTDITVRSKHGCIGLCLAAPSCLLACFNGATCVLYSAYVSFYWNSSNPGSGNILQILEDYKCYSSWYFLGDLTPNITSVAAVSELLPHYTKWKPLRGFYCNNDKFNYFHTSQTPAPSWYEVEFDRVYKMSKVIVKLRYQDLTLNLFIAVKVLVGNQTGVGELFANHITVGNFSPSTYPEQGKIVEFILPDNTFAKYLALTSDASDSFCRFKNHVNFKWVIFRFKNRVY